MIYNTRSRNRLKPRRDHRDSLSAMRSRDYYNSDTWQYWIGALQEEDNEENEEINAAFAAMFQEHNVIEECVQRHVQALLSRSPVFNCDSTTLSEYFADVWEKTLSNFSDDGLTPFEQVQTDAMLDGLGYLRVFQAQRSYGGEEIAMHAPVAGSVSVIKRDDLGKPTEIEYSYHEEVDGIEQSRLERHWVDDVGVTHVLVEDDEELEANEFLYQLNGELLILELKRSHFVTPSMRSAQDALSHAATMIPRNNDLSNHSKIVTNGERPLTGEVVKDEATNEESFPLNRKAMVVAPGAVHWIDGHKNELTGDRAEPQIIVSEPIDVTSFIESAKYFVTYIYVAAKLGHLVAQDITLTGRSRELLRDDFVTSLNNDSRSLSSYFERVFSVFAQVEGRGGSAESNLQIELRPDAGKLSTEEQRAIRENFIAGLMSRETAIALLGYADSPLEEIERIKNDRLLENQINRSGEDNGFNGSNRGDQRQRDRQQSDNSGGN